MFFNNIFISYLKKNESILLNKNTNVFFIVLRKNCNKKLQINLKNNINLNIYLLFLTKNNNICLNLLINHLGNNSNSNIFANVLANNNSNIEIYCQSYAKQNTKNNKINQNINGLIIDKNSTIKTIPSLDINTNKLFASHSANIGKINPEILFYLMTKGLSKTNCLQLMWYIFNKNINKYLVNKKIDISREIKTIFGEQDEQ